jgi:hypothetical protein
MSTFFLNGGIEKHRRRLREASHATHLEAKNLARVVAPIIVTIVRQKPLRVKRRSVFVFAKIQQHS